MGSFRFENTKILLYLKYSEYRLDDVSLKTFRMRERRVVNNLRSYYNFFNNENFELKSLILSANKKSIAVKFKDIYDRVESGFDPGPEKFVEKKKIDFSNLLIKTNKTKELLQNTNLKEKRSYFFNNFCQLTKSKCKNCTASCNFSISQLNEDFKGITVKELKIELKRHKHPMGRVINKKMSNKEQKINELKLHYKTVHRI